MAQDKKKPGKKISFTGIKKLTAAVCLISFFVTIVGGLKEGVSIVTISYRAAIVIGLILLASLVITRIAISYEEIHHGKT